MLLPCWDEKRRRGVKLLEIEGIEFVIRDDWVLRKLRNLCHLT
jgi:hypothetical protein